MSSHLARIAARATRPVTGLRPRPLTLFEQPAHDLSVGEAVAPADPAAVRPNTTVPQGRPASPDPRAGQPQDGSSAAPAAHRVDAALAEEPAARSPADVRRPTAGARTVRRSVGVPLAGRAPPEPAEVERGPADVAPVADDADVTRPTPGVSGGPPAQPLGSERRHPRAETPQGAGRADASRSSPSSGQRPVTGPPSLRAASLLNTLSARDPVPPTIGPTQPAQPTQPTQPTQLPRLATAPRGDRGPAPEVTVNIGRIEVLKPHSTEVRPPARAVRRPAAGAPNLADYLRDRIPR